MLCFKRFLTYNGWIGAISELQMTLQLISATLKMICSLTLIICNHYGIKCLCNRLQLEPWNVMFKVISDIMADWYDMWNIIVIAINCCNGKKMNCALFIIRNQDAISYLSNLLQLERCNVLFNVISDIRLIGIIFEIQLLLLLFSAMQRKRFVHWCLSKRNLME